MRTVKRERLKELAAELRVIAEELRDDHQYKLVRSLARDYERLATAQESRQQQRSPKLKT